MIKYRARHPGRAKVNVPPQYDPARPPPQKAVTLGNPRPRPPRQERKKPMRVLTRNG